MPDYKEIKNIFIDRQVQHIRLVQDYMIYLEKNRDKLPFEVKEFELLRQAMYHDFTKFSDEFAYGFIKIAEYYENKKLGLSNDHIDESTLYKCSDMHYFMEPHHLEYHIKNNTKPSNIDICEMCCDLCANAYRNGEKNFTKYFLEVLVNENDFYRKNKENFLKILNLLSEKNE
jgi:hypothetical protein